MLKRFIPRTVLVLHAADVPNVGMEPLACGFSVHHGVVVHWDADHDPRVLDWLDTLHHGHGLHCGRGAGAYRRHGAAVDNLCAGRVCRRAGVEVVGDSWAWEASTAFADPAEE